jgi:hypothetical protein
MFARQHAPTSPSASGPVAVASAPRRPVTPRGHGGASSVLRPGIATVRRALPSAVLPRAVLAVAAGGTQLSLFGPRPALR